MYLFVFGDPFSPKELLTAVKPLQQLILAVVGEEG
jgi:hypothetical protein